MLSPRFVYGHCAPFTGNGDRDTDALWFPQPHGDDGDGGEGRVTFEGLDSVRACRGEHLPYEHAVPFTRGNWVYQVSDSPWMTDRHAYEFDHYQTPLTGSYRHYLFKFHDEFIEAIAQGIWLDRPDPTAPLRLPNDHPLARLELQTAAENRQSPSGLSWELRRSPKEHSALIEDSKLCSQRLYQFNLVLDGTSSESASVWLRTVDGRTTCRMTRAWVGEVANHDGLASAEHFFDVWEQYVGEVAARRRAMNKPIA